MLPGNIVLFTTDYQQKVTVRGYTNCWDSCPKCSLLQNVENKKNERKLLLGHAVYVQFCERLCLLTGWTSDFLDSLPLLSWFTTISLRCLWCFLSSERLSSVTPSPVVLSSSLLPFSFSSSRLSSAANWSPPSFCRLACREMMLPFPSVITTSSRVIASIFAPPLVRGSI